MFWQAIPSSKLSSKSLRADDYMPVSKRRRLIKELKSNLRVIHSHLAGMERRLKELEET
jgi:hypothetical protein